LRLNKIFIVTIWFKLPISAPVEKISVFVENGKQSAESKPYLLLGGWCNTFFVSPPPKIEFAPIYN